MINQLMNTLQSGARKNKYRISIPILDKDLGSDLSRTVDILCTSTSLPGRVLTPVDVIIKGRKVQIRGETSFEGSWEMNFHNTENMELRAYFLKWMKEVHSTEMNLGGIFGDVPGVSVAQDVAKGARSVIAGISNIASNPMGALNISAAYQRDIKIEQLDHLGEVQYELILIGAFPTSVGVVDYDDSVGEVSTTPVTFSYTDIQYGSQADNLLTAVVGNDIASFF